MYIFDTEYIIAEIERRTKDANGYRLSRKQALEHVGRFIKGHIKQLQKFITSNNSKQTNN